MFKFVQYWPVVLSVWLLIVFVWGIDWYVRTSINKPKPEAVAKAIEEEIIEEISEEEKCFYHNGRNPNDNGGAITYFEDLLTSVKQPAYDGGIFFTETRCSDNAIADLKPR